MTIEMQVDEIVKNEISNIIRKQGYFFESDLCSSIAQKYEISHYLVKSALMRVCLSMSLIKRRISSEMKKLYGLEKIKGYPIIYLKMTD